MTLSPFDRRRFLTVIVNLAHYTWLERTQTQKEACFCHFSETNIVSKYNLIIHILILKISVALILHQRSLFLHQIKKYYQSSQQEKTQRINDLGCTTPMITLQSKPYAQGRLLKWGQSCYQSQRPRRSAVMVSFIYYREAVPMNSQ